MSRQAYADFQAEAAEERAEYANPKPRIRFMTKEMELFAPCGDFRDIKFSDKRNSAGPITIAVPETDDWSEYFYGQSPYAMRPIIVDLPGYRTPWLTTTFARVKERRTRKKYIQIVGVSALEYFNWIRIWPDAGNPPEFQPSKEWSGIAPAATLLSTALIPNLARLQDPGRHVPTVGMFTPASYKLHRNSMWPITVNPRNKGINDATGWTTAESRMDKFMDLGQDVSKLENLDMSMDIYIHGEDPQPFPEFVILERTTFIANFERKGDPLAFTGNAIDGLIRTGKAMAKDSLEMVTYPILKPGERDEEIEAIAVYRDGQHSTIDEAEEVTHIPLATRATVGGKSSDWLNEAVVTGSNLILGVISSAAASIIPGFPALELGIFEDRVKDVVMAFHSEEDTNLAREAGPWRFREAFGETSVTGLSLNAWAAITTTLFDHRGYVSQRIVASHGAPYFIGRDIRKGDPVGYPLPDGSIRVEQVEQIDYEYSRTVRGKFMLQIGSGEAEREPGQLALGKIRKLTGWISRVALGS